MTDLHSTQIGILNKLLFAPNLRHTDLKLDPEIENNTFQFHLKKVIDLGYVKKNGDKYSLTLKGKKFANHIHTEKNELAKIRKVSVSLHCIREKNGVTETLVYKRLKHPFYGKQGFPTGKVDIGENFKDAARRELKEETNLDGDPVLFSITHYLVKDEKTNELLDDKVFLDYFVKNPQGKLKGNDEGEYTWIPVHDFRKHVTNPFDKVEVYEKALTEIRSFKGTVSFQELLHLTNDF